MKRKPIIHPITCSITRGIMDRYCSGDDTPSVPAYVSGVVTDAEPSQVTVTFSAAVTSADYTGGVVIDINGTPVTGLASATVSPSSTIVFTFNEEVVNGDTVTFSYTEASGDYAGDAGDVGDITDAAVINGVIDAPDSFTAGMWALGYGDSVLNVTINSLPDNGGSAITDIEYRLDGGSWISSGGTDSFQISATNGTEYDVQIRAVNAGGNGAASDTKAETPRTVPDNFVAGDWTLADAMTGGTLNVTITNLPDNGGSALTDIEYRVGAGSWTSFGAATVGAYQITGLIDDAAATVRIRAVNSEGNGADSDAKVATPTAPVVSVPNNFTVGMWVLNDAASGGTLNIVISTLPSNGGSAITDIKYRVDGGVWVSVGAAVIGTYQITGLTDGVSYNVELRAENAIGFSAASDTKAQTPTASTGIGITYVGNEGDPSGAKVYNFSANTLPATGHIFVQVSQRGITESASSVSIGGQSATLVSDGVTNAQVVITSQSSEWYYVDATTISGDVIAVNYPGVNNSSRCGVQIYHVENLVSIGDVATDDSVDALSTVVTTTNGGGIIAGSLIAFNTGHSWSGVTQDSMVEIESGVQHGAAHAEVVTGNPSQSVSLTYATGSVGEILIVISLSS